MNSLRILISGGGIGGITAALCLARAGFEVLVLEQAREFHEIGAGIQLSPNCTRVMHHLGLESALRTRACLPQGTEFRQWRSGRVILRTPLGEEMINRFGSPYYHIHRGDLLRVLVEAAREVANIELRTGAEVEGFTQDATGVSVALAVGSERGHLLVGADGIHSTVRARLWGDQQARFTGNIAWRGVVPSHRLPSELIRSVTGVWWGPKRHLVHYYMRGGDLLNCVCVVEKAGWEVESWTAPGTREELASDFAGWHGEVQALINAMDSASLFKWALYDRAPMSQWGKARVTLLGDACHATLPFMAQGAAMAIEDAAVLAACLKIGADLPHSLRRYEDLRRKRTADVQMRSRRNARLFHLSGPLAWLRNLTAQSAGGRTMRDLYAYDALSAANYPENQIKGANGE